MARSALPSRALNHKPHTYGTRSLKIRLREVKKLKSNDWQVILQRPEVTQGCPSNSFLCCTPRCSSERGGQCRLWLQAEADSSDSTNCSVVAGPHGTGRRTTPGSLNSAEPAHSSTLQRKTNAYISALCLTNSWKEI